MTAESPGSPYRHERLVKPPLISIQFSFAIKVHNMIEKTCSIMNLLSESKRSTSRRKKSIKMHQTLLEV